VSTVLSVYVVLGSLCRRNPSYNASRIVYCVVLSVLLGTVYLWKGQSR
jgi:hypothetical protein